MKLFWEENPEKTDLTWRRMK